jgi:tRNA A-37 threonylcarbamoyl transferase component Bud32
LEATPVDDARNNPPPPDSPLPQRFQLGELLGRGAMADVYLAHDQVLDRPVAVKLFRVEPDELARRRFQDEARALARLSHPGLVSVYDVDTQDGRPYLVMAPVLGPSLLTKLSRGTLPPDEVQYLGGVLSAALAHVHSRGVVHRDVKPSNILLDEQGMPHLGDFGIALLAGSARLTRTDELIGTPAYLAPEQVLGEEIGPPADVYALGLVLLECLTGQIEYSGGTEVEIALARLHRPPRIPLDLPFDLAGVIGAMTAADPAERPTASMCVRHLETGPTAGITTARLPAIAGAGAAGAGAASRRGRGALRVWRPLGLAAAGVAALATGLVVTLGSPAPTADVRSPDVAVNQPTQQPTSTQPGTTAPTTQLPPTTPSLVQHHHRGRDDDSGRGPGGPGDHDGHGGGGDGGVSNGGGGSGPG